jgi:8-oxo-dGTP pyrophosphatase MutT (NUDIX family)
MAPLSLSSSTLALLDKYAPFNALEAEHQQRMKTLALRGAAAFSRETYLPGHFTASAFVVTPDRTRVMLILHSKLNLWLQPGGHVDAEDATLEGSARRELREETGLTNVSLVQPGPLDLDIHPIPARGDTAAHEHFDVRFLFTAHDLTYAASSDALDAKWLPLAELSEAATDESVRRAARKIASLSR